MSESNIPASVLSDYQNRTVIEVKNPRWADAEHTLLDADVLFEELSPLGHIAFTTTVDADTAHGQEIWEKANNGDYGVIRPYIPPSEEQLREAMPPLERWRVNTIIDLQPGLREKINAAIEVMPEPQKTISKNKLADVQLFSRTDPLFQMIGDHPDISKSAEDIDAMWQAAIALK